MIMHKMQWKYFKVLCLHKPQHPSSQTIAGKEQNETGWQWSHQAWRYLF